MNHSGSCFHLGDSEQGKGSKIPPDSLLPRHELHGEGKSQAGPWPRDALIADMKL